MQEKKIGVAILGSTGSIGTQALEVIAMHPEKFDLQAITAHKNSDLLIEQAKIFQPNSVVIAEESLYLKVKEALQEEAIHVYCGNEALCQVVEAQSIHVVLSALVGYAGLLPTLHAIEAKKNIALANKETLVVAGELVTDYAIKRGVKIYPVDSEHSAIFQCLQGEFHNAVEKIYLTASGGAFRNYSFEQLKTATKQQALQHPNWNMGAKITIDSATMINKGFEVIEAKWLFGLTSKQIDVIVHPQSVIHSIVQFEDGSMKAQMGVPDMKIPIQFALSYPKRWKSNFSRLNFGDYPQLTFEQPDLDRFPCLQLAYEVMERGGTAACTLNASNEVAVEAFLNDQISFLDIGKINKEVLKQMPIKDKPLLDEYMEVDAQTRKMTHELIRKKLR